MDYLYEEQHRDNLWTDHIFLELGLGVGSEFGGRGIAKYAKGRLSSSAVKYQKKKAKLRAAGVRTGQSWGAGIDTPSPLHESKRIKKDFLTSKAAGQGTLKFGKHLQSIGRGIGGIGLAIGGLNLGKSLAGIGENFRQRKDEMNSMSDPMYESEFMDSGGAFTQRQRAIQVIHNSQLSTRAALGNEARYLHA